MSLFGPYYDGSDDSNVSQTSSNGENDPSTLKEDEEKQSPNQENSPGVAVPRFTPKHERKDSSGRYDLPDINDEAPPPTINPHTLPKKPQTGHLNDKAHLKKVDRRVLLICGSFFLILIGIGIYFFVAKQNAKGIKLLTNKL